MIKPLFPRNPFNVPFILLSENMNNGLKAPYYNKDKIDPQRRINLSRRPSSNFIKGIKTYKVR